MAVVVADRELASRVMELLEEQGRKRSWLAGQLGLTIRQVYGRLEGKVAWTYLERKELERIFGEALAA